MLFHDIGKPRCFTVDEKGIGHFKGHEEISAEINSLENIDIENIEAELDEELSTSAEEIHPLEEIQPLR